MSRVLKKSSGIDCPARTIHEEDLQVAIVTAVNDAWSKRDTVILKLRENILSVLEEDSNGRLEEIDEAIRQKQTEAIAEYSDTLVRRFIEKITVFDEMLVVEFKSGLEIQVEV